jgi:hypothetical protein
MGDLPFTTEQFLHLFEIYNQAIWPAKLTAYLLGISAIWLVIRNGKLSNIIAHIILGIFWIWMGVVYHILFFSGINPAAYFFWLLVYSAGYIILHIPPQRT